MKFTYEVGMRVSNRSQRSFKGTVIEVIDKNEAGVQWDKYSTPSYVEVTEIMPDTPEATQQVAELTVQTQAKIDEATTSLEAFFKAWSEAASLQAGFDGAAPYYLKNNPDLNLSNFENVLKSNGWRTSSLYC